MMDGAVDIKLLVTLGGIVVSMAGAAAVAKSQIQRLTEMLKDIETRMRAYDTRVDGIENTIGKNEHRINILAGMLSPDTMERRNREIGATMQRLSHIEKTIARLEK